MEAGEPEERAAEEKEVEENEGERKAEKMGSAAKVSNGDVAVAVVVGLLKVESRWRGEAVEAGEAAILTRFGFWEGEALLQL